MRVSLSGTHSIGKTTLLNSLKEQEFFKDYTFIPGPTRTLRELGFSINNDSNNYNSTQLMCTAIDLDNLNKFSGNIIQDRCILDTFIYTEYLYREFKVNYSIADSIKSIFKMYIKNIDLIILPDINDVRLISDGVRNSDEKFREDINTMFKNFVYDYKLNYVIVSGTNEQRVEKIKELLK